MQCGNEGIQLHASIYNNATKNAGIAYIFSPRVLQDDFSSGLYVYIVDVINLSD